MLQKTLFKVKGISIGRQVHRERAIDFQAGTSYLDSVKDCIMQAGVHIRVKGVVQGVGFRYFVSKIARQQGLVGYVRNLSNGDVEIFAEGDRSILEELVASVRIGPRSASVTGVDLEWTKMNCTNDDFSIL